MESWPPASVYPVNTAAATTAPCGIAIGVNVIRSFAAAIICAATIPVHATGITSDATNRGPLPYRFSTRSGSVYFPWLYARPANGMRANSPRAPVSMNQLAAPPSLAPESMAPITADPPRIVATRLPATAFADAPLRATKKSGMSLTRRALRIAISNRKNEVYQ